MNQLPITPLRIDLICGIDPDIDKSGVAIWSRPEKRFVLLQCLSFAQLLNLINSHPAGSVLFYVEAGWLNKSIWHGEPAGADKWAMRSRLAHAAEIGRRVGENAAVGKMLLHYLTAHGHEVREEQPTAKKWDAETFRKMTGYQGQTNPEKRDAGRIAFKYQ